MHGRTISSMPAAAVTSSFPVNCSISQVSVLAPNWRADQTQDAFIPLRWWHSTLYQLPSWKHWRSKDVCRVVSSCVAVPSSADFSGMPTKQKLSGLAFTLILPNCSDLVGLESIKSSTIVRDPGVDLEAELNMRRHIAKVAAACFCASIIYVAYFRPANESGRKWQNNLYWHNGIRDITPGLLQLSAIRPPIRYACVAAARSERSYKGNPWSQLIGPRDTGPASPSLVVSTLLDPVQAERCPVYLIIILIIIIIFFF